MTERARILVGAVFGPVLLVHACGRRVELEPEAAPAFDGGRGGSLAVDAAVERILPDGPVPVVEDAGLSLEAGDGCAARPPGCPSTTDFPCAKTEWLTQLIRACRERVGCVGGFLTIRLEDVGCVSEIGMTDVDRAFVDCLVGELQRERCPCSPSLDTFYLGAEC